MGMVTSLHHRYIKFHFRCVNDERFSSFFYRPLYAQTMKHFHLFHIVSKIALKAKKQEDSSVLHRSFIFSFSVVLYG